MVALKVRKNIVAWINEAIATGARKCKACEIIGLEIRTFQRWFNGRTIKADLRPTAKRPMPANKLSEQECQQILKTCNSSDYANLPPSQIVPKLADTGCYLASESSFYRILRRVGQLKHRGSSKPRNPPKKPTSFTATGPNQVWTWDISYLPTGVVGQFFYLYMILDIFSRKIVGADIYHSENGEDAAELVQRSVISEGCIDQPPVLHSDNGAPMKSLTLRAKMHDLGITASRSRPRVSNDNPYSEALFKTVKYCPQWPKQGFSTLEESQAWLEDFKVWYNEEHFHSGIHFVAPKDRHELKDQQILSHREKVYTDAKNKRPERWSKNTRNWQRIDKVELNPANRKEIT